jgi:hypothetical protein
MRARGRSVSGTALLTLGLFLLTGILRAHQGSSRLKIEDVMTATELNDSGVAALTVQQRNALNVWLNRYTARVLRVAINHPPKEAASPRRSAKSDCVPAVESTISGDFNGWDGETIFKLDNGQIWQQAEYDYSYSYSYRPEVTIYEASGGCRMKVEDENETILVRRIR